MNWETVLKNEVAKEYFVTLQSTIASERNPSIKVLPPAELVNKAFELTPFNNIKVVILGQDPYHNIGQAQGLSFSVPLGVKPPPSLVNIYKEIVTDCNIEMPIHGNLEAWARQGVFLLNSILTVRAHQPASHQKIGWQQYTDAVIEIISKELNHVVFMLWGNYAQQKIHLINTKKHLVLSAAHPSPFSAHRGFLGCKHFSKANDYLTLNGKSAIDWRLPNL